MVPPQYFFLVKDGTLFIWYDIYDTEIYVPWYLKGKYGSIMVLFLCVPSGTMTKTWYSWCSLVYKIPYNTKKKVNK